MLVGGIFFIGSLAGPLLKDAARKKLPEPKNFVQKIGGKIEKLLGKKEENNPPLPHDAEYDVTYHTPLTGAELENGKNLQILVHGPNGEQTLKVKIPPGSREGQKLRIKGKGRPGPVGRGDLYLRLEKKD
jgi:curved DNA-binding protein CbpA